MQLWAEISYLLELFLTIDILICLIRIIYAVACVIVFIFLFTKTGSLCFEMCKNVTIEQVIMVSRCHCTIDHITDGFATLHFLLIVLSGDVHPNPGPKTNNLYSDLSICHVNIRSLTQDKLRCIKTSLAQRYDIIAVSETFLSVSNQDSDYELPGFHTILRRDRVGGIGGGVALYVSRALRVKRRTDLEIPGNVG